MPADAPTMTMPMSKAVGDAKEEEEESSLSQARGGDGLTRVSSVLDEALDMVIALAECSCSLVVASLE